MSRAPVGLFNNCVTESVAGDCIKLSREAKQYFHKITHSLASKRKVSMRPKLLALHCYQKILKVDKYWQMHTSLRGAGSKWH